ncbi:unnamed protein product [Linum tenue]|uniref:EF-hand domain-containing protein n=1 Tax=Linum tenue TaxID=586396 RepID=A0AAV0P785_9ROSI|nr:unnamed protein product [Linum tenue]
MATRGSRSEKVKRIFQQFDLNSDGGLNREEMSALVVAVNPRVKFSEEQINAILDEVFRTYGEFIDGDKGLTFEGLLRTYDDGAGDVDRDFDALELELNLDDNNNDNNKGISEAAEASSSIADERVIEAQKKQRTAAWAVSPNHGILFDDTWKIVDDLEILIKRLKAKQAKDGKLKGDNVDSYSDAGWSRELGPSSEISDKRIIWEEAGHDYASFVKELGALRTRADGARSREEAFDGHMAIGVNRTFSGVRKSYIDASNLTKSYLQLSSCRGSARRPCWRHWFRKILMEEEEPATTDFVKGETEGSW